MGLDTVSELRYYVMENYDNKEYVRKTVWNINFSSPGRRYFMNQPEIGAMAHYSFSATDHASGYGREGMAVSSVDRNNQPCLLLYSFVCVKLR